MDFTIYQRDRNSHGGGVLLAVKNDISSKMLDTLSDIEGITVEINHMNPVIISVIYATPQSSISYVNNCCKQLSNLSDTCLTIIVVGDFNLRDINWETLSGAVLGKLLCKSN